MAPSCRVLTKPLALAGSSLLASEMEAARSLKDASFGEEMRKGEDFVAVRSKGGDGGREKALKGWSKGGNFGLGVKFGTCGVEGECDKERRVCILEFREK